MGGLHDLKIQISCEKVNSPVRSLAGDIKLLH